MSVRRILLLTPTLALCLTAAVRAQDPKGSELRINPRTVGQQWLPDVATAADGHFVVVWREGADFARDSVALEPIRFVNAFLRGFQGDPAVTALQTGGFLVTWTSGAGQDGDDFGIFARVYGADGRPRGREFRINLLRTGSQTSPAISIAPNGKGAAVWSSPDGDATGIFARRIGKPQP